MYCSTVDLLRLFDDCWITAKLMIIIMFPGLSCQLIFLLVWRTELLTLSVEFMNFLPHRLFRISISVVLR